jgi:hypothetical protein
LSPTPKLSAPTRRRVSIDSNRSVTPAVHWARTLATVVDLRAGGFRLPVLVPMPAPMMRMYFPVVQAQGDRARTFHAAKRCRARLSAHQLSVWEIVVRSGEGVSEFASYGSTPRGSDERLDGVPDGSFVVDADEDGAVRVLVEDTLANLTTADLAADVVSAAVVAG